MRRSIRRAPRQPRCELLESRRLLAAVAWTGAGDGVTWTDPGNWDGGAVPIDVDDVTIDVPGADPTIVVPAGTHIVRSLDSAEAIRIDGGGLGLAQASTVRALTIAAGGSTFGSGDLTVEQALVWESGEMRGVGRTILPSGATASLTTGGAKLLNRTFTVSGSADYSGGGLSFNSVTGFVPTLSIAAGATFAISGEGDFAAANPGGLISNAGTIAKTGAGTSVLHVPLNQPATGRADVASGALQLAGAGFNAGRIDAAAGASLFVASNYAVSPSGRIGGEGDIRFLSGASAIDGQLQPLGLFRMEAGSLALKNELEIPGAFEMTGGLIDGGARVVVEGTMLWTGGTFAGSASVLVAAGATGTITGPATKRLDTRFMEIQGAVVWDQGPIELANGLTLVVATAGLFTVAADAPLTLVNGGGTPSLKVSGTLLKQGASSLTIGAGVGLSLDGLVNVAEGTLEIVTYTSTVVSSRWDIAGTLVLPGTITTLAADLTLRPGAVFDAATRVTRLLGIVRLVDGHDFSITPGGDPAGTLTYEADVVLSPGSTFTVNGNVVFAGARTPSVASQIGPSSSEVGVATGALQVNGTLDLTSPLSPAAIAIELVGGVDPGVGEALNIVSATSIVDDFDSFTPATTPGGGHVLLQLGAAGVQSVVAATLPPAPQATSAAFEYQTREALALQFNTDVGAFLSRADLALANLGGGPAPAPGLGAWTYDPATFTATLVLSGLLPDGDYRLTVAAGKVANAAGMPLATPITLDFHVLAGDANRDRAVDVADLGILATNWQQAGKVFGEGDFTYDGVVDVADLGILATNWQAALMAFAPAQPASPFARRRLIALLDG